MKRTATALAALALLAPPLAAQAAEADLAQRIEALSRELEQLRQQVRANDEKAAKAAEAVRTQQKKRDDRSLDKWLSVGGGYRFRYDYLRGETRPFTDVAATFANAQNLLQADFFGNPSTAPGSSRYFGAPQAGSLSTAGALSALMAFSQAMNQVATLDEARAFVADPANAGLIQGLGAFAVPVPAYKPRNASLYSHRFDLDLHAKATDDVGVTARLNMIKIFGAQDAAALTNGGGAPFFADRVGVFDGTIGHLPSSSALNVDRAYATWSDIGGEPVWFSVGRRPSTAGAPAHLRLNEARGGTSGTPSLLVDYAFDGMTLGWAPDLDGLPGAYGKICYGRGFDGGLRDAGGNSLKDTDMIGLSVVPIDTDRARVWLQWNRGMNIFDAPTMKATYFGDTAPQTNLGDIDWYGVGVSSTMKRFGPGDLNWYAEAAVSVTHPNQNVSAQFGLQGLLTGAFFAPEAASSKRGNAVSLGLRYDLPSRTKIGVEYNRGSKHWITFAPAADDAWTAKVGTRGQVWEGYLIQELDQQPVSSYFSKAFFRFGVQVYDFDWTGSNNWVGAPLRIDDVAGQLQTLTPLKNATNAYATFEVRF